MIIYKNFWNSFQVHKELCRIIKGGLAQTQVWPFIHWVRFWPTVVALIYLNNKLLSLCSRSSIIILFYLKRTKNLKLARSWGSRTIFCRDSKSLSRWIFFFGGGIKRYIHSIKKLYWQEVYNTFIFFRASSSLVVSVALQMFAQCQKCRIIWSDHAWIFSMSFRCPAYMYTEKHKQNTLLKKIKLPIALIKDLIRQAWGIQNTIWIFCNWCN